jgi:hypothetical protein
MNRNPRIRKEFAKQETKARVEYTERALEYVKDPSLYESDRQHRLAAYKAIHGGLPASKIRPMAEVSQPSAMEPMGFTKFVCEPTRVEKPVRRTVFKYRPTSV